MFFYRAKAIEAPNYEALMQKTCPICSNALTPDWGMPFRHSPAVLFRLLGIAGAMAVLLLLFTSVNNTVSAFLNQFSYTTQTWINVGLVSACFPVAFFIIKAELKIAYLSEYDMVPTGLYCEACGNGYVGLIDFIQQENKQTSGADDENNEM